MEASIELVEAARHGGALERDALVEAVWPDAYRIAFATLRQREAAEDAAQEACIILCRSLATLRDAHAFRVWFYRVVLREASRIRKRLARTSDVVETRSHEDRINVDVWRALASLAPHLRDVVMLRYFEDLNSREIASVLRVPEGTVRFRLMIAKRRLRPLLDEATSAAPSDGEVRTHAV